MKITDPDVIKNGEKDLIKAVKEDLDMEAVKDIIKKRMAKASLSAKGGEIVVYNNQVAFRLDFDIQLSGSLMFDRQGNYIPESDEPDDQENFISEEFDLDDMDMNETLEEIGPQTPPTDTENAEIEEDNFTDEELIDDALEEELDIDLPDYGLDDESEPESDDDETGDAKIETEQIEENADSEIAIDDLEQLTDDSDAEENDLIQNDIVDDDINDILKESREFWELKKDS
ncbi:MAG: hypothetical protein KKE44_16210 [Proteobacteria bacterium]|nr:hypothetical protein [Pseudomonadota bacterium]MBU1584273.1 hypothetical protein [Pseudomonadota bacterium]MBU2629174.1 hypothetical protein [Pseudomonadota bacterium]